MRPFASLRGCLALALAVGSTGRAQSQRRVDLSPADVAIAHGQLGDAEELLYAASRRAPRDPIARGALGAWLAARGRLMVGAVLLGEARQFGAAARPVDDRLRHVYAWLGDWEQVAALPNSPTFDAAEHARARWLAANPPDSRGPDSSAVPLEANELDGLGRISIDVGGVPLRADIDPTIEGLVLPGTVELMGAVQLFGTQGDASIAVAYVVALGARTLANVPARLEPGGRARIGLDVLAASTPTFDAAARRLTLHASGAPPARGEEIPILLAFPGVMIAAHRDQPPAPLESAAGRAALRGAVWTFDLKRGAVIVDRKAERH